MEPNIIIVGRDTVPPRGEFTVSQYAAVEQVDRKTVLRWIAKGALVVRRTPGGHFRIKGTR